MPAWGHSARNATALKPSPTPFAIVRLLLCVAALLSSPSTSRAAPAGSPGYPPGTREIYGGLVCEYVNGAIGEPAVTRSGSVQLEVVDGVMTGRFTFLARDQTSVSVDVRGTLDPVTSRGSLKLDAPAGEGMKEKVAVLLRQGVITGGTMEVDGRVLAFRLERFLVVLP